MAGPGLRPTGLSYNFPNSKHPLRADKSLLQKPGKEYEEVYLTHPVDGCGLIKQKVPLGESETWYLSFAAKSLGDLVKLLAPVRLTPCLHQHECRHDSLRRGSSCPQHFQFSRIRFITQNLVSWTTGMYCVISLEGSTLQIKVSSSQATGKNLVQASLSFYWFAGNL